jgi:diacylglycerol O-acyltransferase / wax synthase
VAIGITSYDGGLYYGVNADRDRMPDVGVLAQCLVDALDELAEAPVRGRDDGKPPVNG